MQHLLPTSSITRSGLLDQLRNHINQRLDELQARRSDIPALLGFTATNNPTKCLRRFDAVCHGDLRDRDLIERIVASPFGGATLADVFTQLRHLDTVDQREQALLAERRARENFVPHIHAIHERWIPEHPFFVIASLGIDHFKRVDLPASILEMTDTSAQLLAIWDLMDHICTSEEYKRITGGPFGRATTLLYRDAYDHAYVYDVQTRALVDERHGAPATGTASTSLGGKQI